MPKAIFHTRYAAVLYFYLGTCYSGSKEVINLSKSINESLNTAFASARMEGIEITPKIEADCMMIISGELSIQEYIRRVTESAAQNGRSVEHVVQP